MFGTFLGGMFNLLGGAFQNSYNTSSASTSYNRQRLLNEQAAQLQMENWQKQFDATNAYNSPSSQLDRLYDAGINPLYDSGLSNSSSFGSAAAAPSGSAPIAAPSADLKLGDALLQGALLQKTKAETRKIDEESKGITIDNGWKDTFNSLQRDTFISQLESLSLQKDKTKKETDLLIEQTSACRLGMRQVAQDMLNKVTELKQKWYQLFQTDKQLEHDETRLQQGQESLVMQGRELALRNKIASWEHEDRMASNENAAEKNRNDAASSKALQANNIINAFLKSVDQNTSSFFGFKVHSNKDGINRFMDIVTGIHNYLSDDKASYQGLQKANGLLDDVDNTYRTIEDYLFGTVEYMHDAPERVFNRLGDIYGF